MLSVLQSAFSITSMFKKNVARRFGHQNIWLQINMCNTRLSSRPIKGLTVGGPDVQRKRGKVEEIEDRF